MDQGHNREDKTKDELKTNENEHKEEENIGFSPTLAGSHYDEEGYRMIVDIDDRATGQTGTSFKTGQKEMVFKAKESESNIKDYVTPADRGKKRKTEDPVSPNSVRIVTEEFWNKVESLCKRNEEMLELITKQQVKVVIKEKARESNNIVKSIRRLSKNMEIVKTSETGKDNENLDLTIDYNEQGTQTEEDTYCLRCKTDIDIERKNKKKIELGIEEIMEEGVEKEGGKTLLALTKKDWPLDIFENTMCREGKISKEPKEYDKIIIIGEEEAKRMVGKEDTNWIEQVTGQLGILTRMTGRLNTPFLCTNQATFAALGEEVKKEPETKIYVITTSRASGAEDLVKQYKALETISDQTKEEGHFAISISRELEIKDLRKLLECILRKKNQKGVILNTMKQDTQRKTETIIIKPTEEEPKTFAEILQAVKGGVNPKDFNVNVKSIKQTKDGSVMIVADKGGQGEEFRNEIARRMTGTDVFIGGKRQIDILDLDVTTSKEDIMEEIVKQFGTKSDFFNIENVWTTRAGQRATITATTELARKLEDAGYIKIGWISCRVKEHIGIERCMNCLEMGHSTRRCSQPWNADIKCLKCTKSGHKAKDCQNEKYCMSCNANGHRGDTFACPFFRELVAARRRNRNY